MKSYYRGWYEPRTVWIMNEELEMLTEEIEVSEIEYMNI